VSAPAPARGEVWLADLNPTRGHEQAGQRPFLVVSTDAFNEGPAGLVIGLPLTSRLRAVPTHVRVAPPGGGLSVESAALCEAIRSIARERLVERWGRVGGDVMRSIEDALRILLEL
jgi:mRNA interferase MazF